MRGLLLGFAVATALWASTSVAFAADVWRLEQPAPPAGAPFKVALGVPGDLKFWAPNRGLLAVAGNAVIPRGLFVWNGQSWRQLAVVCGGSGDTTRIAWAGPTEFWVISAPSRPRTGDGISLCHFKDGAVVASYGTLPNAPDPYQVMNAATCASASDCWFGGPAADDPNGGRSGDFRLHWDGQSLTTSYGPQGRGVSDMQAFAGTIFESLHVGPGAGARVPPDNREPEPVPRLVHRLQGGAFSSDPFVPEQPLGAPVDGTEALALDSDGQQLWVVGGGAASGASAPESGPVIRPPFAARRGPGESALTEVLLNAPAGTFAADDRFVDIAALPGLSQAWVAVQSFAARESVNAKAKVALLDASSGLVTPQQLPASGAGRGSAAKIACPAIDQCWMVTYAGWLFHYSNGDPLPVDTDPAFSGLITFRPNESAAQFVPDTPPVDDSLLLAPPPVEVEPTPAAPITKVKRVKALIRDLKRPRVVGTTLVLRFRLTRKAHIQLVARRKGKTVARTKNHLYRAGHITLRLKLSRKHWPTKLKFIVKEPGQSTPGDDGSDTITTGGSGTDTTTAGGAPTDTTTTSPPAATITAWRR